MQWAAIREVHFALFAKDEWKGERARKKTSGVHDDGKKASAHHIIDFGLTLLYGCLHTHRPRISSKRREKEMGRRRYKGL
jgi:hypothetical protein